MNGCLVRRQRLVALFPVSCHIRLLEGGKIVAEKFGDRLEYDVSARATVPGRRLAGVRRRGTRLDLLEPDLHPLKCG